jgi:hypothetical protein
MRPILLAIALILVASANLQATEGMNFYGGGYRVEIVVGFGDDGPVVGSVRLTRPGAKEWVGLPHELVRVEKFDIEKEILVLHFSKQNDPDPELPRSLSLTVKKEKGVLTIDGKKIKGTLGDWNI